MSARAPERGLLPIALPVLLLGMIAGAAFLFSRVLLNVDKTVAVAVALMMAFNLLAFFSFMSSRIGRADAVEKVVALGVLLLPLVLGTAVAAKIIPTKGGEEHGAEAAGPTTVKLSAADLEFDKDEITFPAAAEVKIQLDNQDSQPHNVVVFNGPDANAEPLNDGEPIADPKGKATYTIKSPDKPGTYYFHCAIHPTMKGKVVVTEAKGGEEGGEAGGAISLSAADLKFDKDEMTAKAGADVEIKFTNKDSQPHNVVVFNGPDANAEPLNDGEPIADPKGKATYKIKAPDKPGTYYFHCAIHPTMKGKLVVE